MKEFTLNEKQNSCLGKLMQTIIKYAEMCEKRKKTDPIFKKEGSFYYRRERTLKNQLNPKRDGHYYIHDRLARMLAFEIDKYSIILNKNLDEFDKNFHDSLKHAKDNKEELIKKYTEDANFMQEEIAIFKEMRKLIWNEETGFENEITEKFKENMPAL